MKRKQFLILMGIVFAMLMALVLFIEGLPEAFSSVMAFPFEQLGAGLKLLSLSGSFGNGLSLLLYAALALLPAIFALRHRGERAFLAENIVLYCTSLAVFVTLYGMANPGRFLPEFCSDIGELIPAVKSVLGCTAWSFAVLWLVLRLIRLFREGDTARLLGYLRIALYALCLIFDAVIALSCGTMLLDSLSATQQGMDGAMAVLHFLASALCYGLDIVVTLSLLSLLDAYIAKDRGDIAECADALSRRCCLALGITAASTAALNLIQLLFARLLSDVSVSINIPVVSLVFILLVLLLSRLIIENRRLQSDNELFI